MVTKFGLEVPAGSNLMQEVLLLMQLIAFKTLGRCFLERSTQHLNPSQKVRSPWKCSVKLVLDEPARPKEVSICEVSLTERTVPHLLRSYQDVASEKEIRIETKFPAWNLIQSTTFEDVFNHRHITELAFLPEIHFTILQIREAQNVSTMFSKKCQLFWYFRHQDLSKSNLPDILCIGCQ